MGAPPAGISEADWLATPVAVRALSLGQHDEIKQLRAQLTTLATELGSLRERIGCSSRNSSQPHTSKGPGYEPPRLRRQGSRRKRGSQPGHPGSGPELLPIERVDEAVEHHPDACRRYASDLVILDAASMAEVAVLALAIPYGLHGSFVAECQAEATLPPGPKPRRLPWPWPLSSRAFHQDAAVPHRPDQRD